MFATVFLTTERQRWVLHVERSHICSAPNRPKPKLCPNSYLNSFNPILYKPGDNVFGLNISDKPDFAAKLPQAIFDNCQDLIR